MLKNRTELVKKFINEGFTHRTLSLFSDIQLKELHKKIFKEEVSIEAAKQAKEILIKKAEEELAHLQSENDTTEEELDIETDDTGNPDVDIDGTPLLREKEIEEDFESKAQQKYLYAVNPAAAEKLASKMTKKDYEKLPEYVNEQKILEDWVMSVVESEQKPEITKANFIKTIRESIPRRKKDVGTPEQNESFEMVEDIAREMNPYMNVRVDDFDDDGHLNGMLASDDSDISLNICPQGNIKLNGITLGESDLSETDRDDEGEYMGAPEATTAPTPVKTPTIAPSRPGEKKRRGPFQKPKTTPKPKAKDKDVPEWFNFNKIKSQVENK